MDVKLVGAAVQFHGEELLHSLTDEQGEQPSSNVTSYLQRWRPSEPEIKDKKFQRDLCSFIARKSDLLFRPLKEEEKNDQRCLEAVDDSFAIMPPLETFMGVPSYTRREQFWKSLQVNDCVTGVVSAIIDQGLRLTLLCVDKGVCRDIDDLNIPAFCPVKELPRLYAKESALDAFQKRDIVRGIVLSVVEETERIIISLRAESVPDEKTYPRIGLITEDDFPVHYRRQSQIQNMSYEEMLQSILGFNNTGNVQSLTKQLKIPTQASYYRFFARLKIPAKEFAEGLQKWQSQKLAHQSVVQGVETFKRGEYTEAMHHLNRALQVDAENVEALVARGALYANKENFTLAIKDFEAALLLNPKHNNAKNYLMETLLTVGRMCEERRDLSQAVKHYENVLKMDKRHKEATELLQSCRQLMAFQTGHDESKEEDFDGRRERSTPDESADEENAVKDKRSSSSLLKTSTDKLKALIKEDKERKPRSSKREKHGRSESSSSERDTKKRKQRKKKKRRSTRSVSSSSSDSDSRSSDSSRSPSSSPKRNKKSRKKKRGKDRKHSKKSKRSRKGSETSKRHEKSKEEFSADKELSTVTRGPVKPMETGRREHIVEEKEKDMPSYEAAQAALEEQKKEELFYHRTAASSFLPLTSFDFFSKSTAIPGLGSPSPPHSAPPHAASHMEVLKSLPLLRDSPSQGRHSPSHINIGKDEGALPHDRGLPISESRSPTDAGRKYRNQSEMSRESHDSSVHRGLESERYTRNDRSVTDVKDAVSNQRATIGASRSERETAPSEDPHMIRRDDILIAQRKKFYRENNEDSSYRRFRSSRSRSSSRSSRSRSGSPVKGDHEIRRSKRSRTRSRSRNRSPRSRSQEKRADNLRSGKDSPVITGIKELDRYLGGAKFLIQKAMESKGYSSWEGLARSGEASRKWDNSRSPTSADVRSRSRKSLSPARYRSRSPPLKRFKSRSPSPKRYKSKSPSLKRFKSRSPSPKRYYKSRSPSPKRHQSRSPSSNSKHSPSAVKGRKPGITGTQSKSPKSPLSDQWASKLFSARRATNEFRNRSQSPRPRVGKEELENERNRTSDSPPARAMSSFGKFGPPAKQPPNSEKSAVSQEEAKITNVKQSTVHEPDALKDSKTGGERSVKGEKSYSKRDSASFMPRVLRKPKMDDPDLIKPLISSNQLERDKKMLKKTMEDRESQESNDKNPAREKEESFGRPQGKGGGSPVMTGMEEKEKTEAVDGENGAAVPLSGKARKSRWDEDNNSRKNPAQAPKTKQFEAAKLSGLEKGPGDEAKRSLEEEMEREIERRVRERLRQQENQGDKSSDNRVNTKGSPSSVDKPYSSRVDKARDYSSDDEGDAKQHKKKREDERSYNKGYKRKDNDDSDDEIGYHDKKNRTERARDYDRRRYEKDDYGERTRYRKGGREGWSGRGRGRRRDEVRENKKGWCEDCHGNAYFAEYGKSLYVGKNYDFHGNVFFVQPNKEKNKSHKSRSKSQSCSRSRSRGRSRSRSRSSSSSRSDRGSHNARKQKQSRLVEKPGSKSNEAQDEFKQTGKEATHSGPNEALGRKSKGQVVSAGGLAQQSGAEATGMQVTLEEKNACDVSDSAADMAGSSNADRPSSELEELTRSKWDTEYKSRWDEGAGGKEGTAQAAGKGNSLTDLEKFLLDLKQQKKKQWIAEGKIKEK